MYQRYSYKIIHFFLIYFILLITAQQTKGNNNIDAFEQSINYYDKETNESNKIGYIKQALQLAIQIKDNQQLFETLDILTTHYHQQSDSVKYYLEIGRKNLTGKYKDIYLAWLEAYPDVLNMIEATDASEVDKEVKKYRKITINSKNTADILKWNIILTSSIESMAYLSDLIENIKESTPYLLDIEKKVNQMPFQVAYKFQWYVHTRLGYVYRLNNDEKNSIIRLEQLKEFYDKMFNLEFYKKRKYLDKEQKYLGIYDELLYFAQTVGREKTDENFEHIKQYYQNHHLEDSESYFSSCIKYYLYTQQYNQALQGINTYLKKCDDKFQTMEMISKKIDIYKSMKHPDYKDAFESMLQYQRLQQSIDYDHTQSQMKEMEARFKVDHLKMENLELQANMHKAIMKSFVFALIIAVIFICYLLFTLHRLRKMHKELVISNHKAEESERLKTNFINSISHEVRTPMNAITGFSELIVDSDISMKMKKDFGQQLITNVHLLTNIVDSLIETSTIISSFNDKDLKKTDLDIFCQDIFKEFQQKSAKQGINYQYLYTSSSKAIIQTYPQYLKIAINKLLDNANKFTEEGQITLVLSCEQNQFKISVTDTGIGIEQKDHQRIFERFTKLDDFTQGIGNGLYICRLIIQRMGGKVFVDPTENEEDAQQGTRMSILLP